MIVGESRSELLNWLNGLLQLEISKVEQCGTGAVYCQIIDSIYQDVPMSKVKFELNGSEYNYLQNYKILQSAFVRHQISKPIPVERLVKCKMQDNLEFLQWIKKFWMDNKDETEYDATGRRNGSRGMASNRIANPPKRVVSGGSTGGPTRTLIRSRTPSSGSVSRSSLAPGATSSTQLKSLQEELHAVKQHNLDLQHDLQQYKTNGEGLEAERDFYFKKLREIEILSQSVQELVKSGNNDITLNGVLTQIEEILYSTEEGFQAPETEEPAQKPNDQMILDEETF